MKYVNYPSELDPGDVIDSSALTADNPTRGIGVVTNKRCPTGCGYLVVFQESALLDAQCTASLVNHTTVTRLEI